MSKRKIYFKQVPVEVVKKIAVVLPEDNVKSESKPKKKSNSRTKSLVGSKR